MEMVAQVHASQLADKIMAIRTASCTVKSQACYDEWLSLMSQLIALQNSTNAYSLQKCWVGGHLHN